MRGSLLAGRVIGAGLLGATAGIHFYLWSAVSYKDIPTIGPLFLVNGVGASVLVLAVLALPAGLVHRLAAASGGLLEIGTLGGLLIAVNYGLFGFTESTKAPLFWQSIAVEAAGTVVLFALALARPGRSAVPPTRVRSRAGSAAGR